ncbi:MAG: AAA family ATPase [Acidimicrobiia bacterium]|nr:AAA family ATPase [Acidimicrobiia bacterium]
MEPLINEFLAERKYPTPSDEEHRADRQRLAEVLAADAIALADIDEIRRICTGSRYGNPGPMSGLHRSFRDASAAEYDRMIDTLRYLCWDKETDAKRIDRVLTDEDMRIPGLGESVIMKLLAITHPESYLPIFPYSGPAGKRLKLQLLKFEEPAGTRGEIQVESNRLLYTRLEPYFPGDPWGMSRFLYWFRDRDEESEIEGGRDFVAELADELLIDRSFLDDVIVLLEDKGQVIFYGPPGTGKTYLARKLAEVLAPDPRRRALVQFHPSSSYEDFFEGYRPEADVDGDMSYRLTPGPLALMAARAAEAPGRRHVMIIDEINRANLPKVFGEMLFLLEYRGESVRTLYRPDDAFELPQDLWFIGTMNTADRSIALIDAALRRRFHFIPFFPNQGAVQGLLERWIKRHHGEGARWVWELVAQVNDELIAALGGPHLQIGPSHFMKENLDEAAVRRIWQFNIEPFIEDQFFGDTQQIERFRFEAALERYQERSGENDQSVQPPTAEESGESGGEGGVAAEGA